MSDVIFTFKKYGDRKLQAHRLVLSMRSAIFEAMFFGPMTNNGDEIDIEDVEPDIFDLVLGYIYTDKAELNGDTVLKCLYGARKYCLNGLVKLCSEFLEHSISPDNVCTIYEQAKFFDVELLQSKCYKFLVENSKEVFKSEDVTKLSHKSLLHVMDDDSLKSEEIIQFNMALRWAEGICLSENIEPSSENKRKVLGDILGKIRFPVIPAETFANVAVPTQILLDVEQIQLLQFMVTRSTGTPGSVGRFISLPRKGMPLVVKLDNVGSLSTFTVNAFVIKVRSNFSVALVSFPKISFQTLLIQCGNELETKRISVNEFQNIDGEMSFKIIARRQVFLPNKQYTLTFKDGSILFQKSIPSYTIRRVCHVEKFGELSITFDEVPQWFNKMNFCIV